MVENQSMVEAVRPRFSAAQSSLRASVSPTFVDRSASGAQLASLVQMMQTSPQVTAQLALNARLADGAAGVAQRAEGDEEELLQGKFAPVQRVEGDEEELLQGKFALAQRAEMEDEELLQGKFAPAQRAAAESSPAPSPNQTGLPDHLKAGIESLSGISLDQVRVHYNSSQPAQLNAHAYAQGTEIHLAPGQEQHLPHEAWHVVQQAQGRVKPTMQMHGGVAVNDDAALEREADVMGAKAAAAGNGVKPSEFYQRRAKSVTVDHQPRHGGVPNETRPLNSPFSELQLRSTGPTEAGSIAHTRRDNRTLGSVNLNDRPPFVQISTQLQNFTSTNFMFKPFSACEVVQMNYIDALKTESEHAVKTRFTKAILAHRFAESKEARWRLAQVKGSPLEERASEFQAAMQKGYDEFDKHFQVLSVWYGGKGKDKLDKNTLKSKSLEDIAPGIDFFERLRTGALTNYRAEAEKQFGRSSSQGELLLGYRASVANEKNPREKILDTNIWSWGVNQAWIEGGASNKASFTLDTNIGEIALDYLRSKNGEEFLEAIKPDNWPMGEANMLWHNQEDRPTWYALELSGLLDMGYRPNQEGTKLVSPQGKIKNISGKVERTGVISYINGER